MNDLLGLGGAERVKPPAPVVPPALAGAVEGPGLHYGKPLQVGPDMYIRVRKGMRAIVVPTGHAGTLLVKVVSNEEWDASTEHAKRRRRGMAGFGFINDIAKALADIVGSITKGVKDGRDAKMLREERGAAGLGCSDGGCSCRCGGAE